MNNGGAAGAAAAAAAVAQAVKASGTIVRVRVEEFRKLLDRNADGLVVHAEGGLFSVKHQYLMGYKGLAFFASSRDKVFIPSSCQVVEAEKIWIPG
jgi:hypothetical protein